MLTSDFKIMYGDILKPFSVKEIGAVLDKLGYNTAAFLTLITILFNTKNAIAYF